MTALRPRMSWLLTLTALLLSAASGCSEKLLRENVLANTETAVGIMIAENVQTQLYEVKLGYVRHEFFLVPTSKTITYDADKLELDVVNGDPSMTPEVLADIGVGGKTSGREAGFEVRQRLAVGKLAVMAPSATALMSKDAATADAASKAAIAESEAKYDAITQRTPAHNEEIKKFDQLYSAKVQVKADLNPNNKYSDMRAYANEKATGVGGGNKYRDARDIRNGGSLEDLKEINKIMDDAKKTS